MSSKASVEIWQTILKYAIYVPLFFDSDPVEGYGIDILQQYTYESPYWHSERIRNSLRRVSHSWDAFLKPYEHRFVRLDDILHNKVPVSALPSALRLDLDSMEGCRGSNCHHPDTGGYWTEMTEMWRAAPFSRSKESGEAQEIIWNAKIVKGWNMYDLDHMNLLKKRAPALRVLIFQPLSMLMSPNELPQALNLLLTEIDEIIPNFNVTAMKSLTTVQAVLTSLITPIDACSFPCLKHLSITLEDPIDPLLETLYEFVQGIGPQLRTFHLHHTLTPISIEPVIWDIFPKVERIQLPYRWAESQVPSYHPLERIQISTAAISNRMMEGFETEEEIVSFLPHSDLRNWTIRMETTWKEELFMQRSLTLWLAKYYSDRSTLFVDAHGDTLSQYIVFLISAFWKQPGRQYHKSLTSCEGPFLPF